VSTAFVPAALIDTRLVVMSAITSVMTSLDKNPGGCRTKDKNSGGNGKRQERF
jgi:hypothetical protein